VSSQHSFDIVVADTPERVAHARELFQEYAAAIATEVCFKSFDEELASLPGAYGPPRGLLLLTYAGDEPIGCVALRDLGQSSAEMKRVYVRPSSRAAGAGRALVEAIMASAASLNYRRIRLDTLPSMTRAITLYEELGFVRVDPYGPGAAAGALFFELALALRRAARAAYTGLASKDRRPRGERYVKELKKGHRLSGTPRNLS
jgi:putative acetyltransferase